MKSRHVRRALPGALVLMLVGCTSPLDDPSRLPAAHSQTVPDHRDPAPLSRFRPSDSPSGPALAPLDSDASPDDYVRFALYNNPEVEAAYQRWRAATERLPQVRALPDPRVNVGFFVEEVETRVGPQEARLGVSQTFPFPGKLDDREHASSKAALAAWRTFEAIQLDVTERVVERLHELAYLDASTRITIENLELLRSFEEVLRARYRVGAGSHPELIRVQVELGQLEDRVSQLRAMRPASVASLNASLNRSSAAEIPELVRLPARVADRDADALIAIAREANPTLLAIDARIEEARGLTEVARNDGMPDLTVGLDYIVTGEADDRSVSGSGDDPILLTFGFNVPLGREKYDAGVREAMARRFAVAHERSDAANRVEAAIRRAWFDHMDGDRRVRLYEDALIPKAEESIRASLAGFRAGETGFLDLLDTERTLLEFAIAAERARADRGKALARLHRLTGTSIPTRPADAPAPKEASQ